MSLRSRNLTLDSKQLPFRRSGYMRTKPPSEHSAKQKLGLRPQRKSGCAPGPSWPWLSTPAEDCCVQPGLPDHRASSQAGGARAASPPPLLVLVLWRGAFLPQHRAGWLGSHRKNYLTPRRVRRKADRREGLGPTDAEPTLPSAPLARLHLPPKCGAV